MNKESLISAYNMCFESITNSKINELDKLELLINLKHFLNENEYEDNKLILCKSKRGRK